MRLSNSPWKQLFLYNKKQSERNTDKLHFDWLPLSHIFRLGDMSWCPHFGNCYIAWKYDKSEQFKKRIMLLHKSEKSQFSFDILRYSKPKVHFCVKVIQQTHFETFSPKTDADRWSSFILFTFFISKVFITTASVYRVSFTHLMCLICSFNWLLQTGIEHTNVMEIASITCILTLLLMIIIFPKKKKSNTEICDSPLLHLILNWLKCTSEHSFSSIVNYKK